MLHSSVQSCGKAFSQCYTVYILSVSVAVEMGRRGLSNNLQDYIWLKLGHFILLSHLYIHRLIIRPTFCYQPNIQFEGGPYGTGALQRGPGPGC